MTNDATARDSNEGSGTPVLGVSLRHAEGRPLAPFIWSRVGCRGRVWGARPGRSARTLGPRAHAGGHPRVEEDRWRTKASPPTSAPP